MEKSLNQLLEFGIINIDKPTGPTSFSVDEIVKEILKLRKTSHGGTLDPAVTGVLPIFLNRACKLLGFFLGEDKEYIGVMRLHEEVSMKKVQEIINKKFLGKIKQTPPVKSRVKRQEREREIKSFELLEQDGKDILFKTEVQGGTYIRKLIDDLGKEPEIGGAHMLELRRTKAGIFDEKKVYTLYDLEKAKNNEEALKRIIIPGEEALKKIFSSIQVKESSIKNLLTGKPVRKEDLDKKQSFETGELINLFSGERLIGVYKVVNEVEIFAKPEFVLQDIKG